MRHTTRLTFLSQCILLSLVSFSGSVLANTCASNDISQSCGLSPYNNDGNLYQNPGVTNAVLANDNDTEGTDIFMDGQRADGDTQSLVLNDATMSDSDGKGSYIQGSNGGTANITLENGSRTDMIEVGAQGKITNTTVTVDDSTLNGEQYNMHYSGRDKRYMDGAAIYIDPLDNGSHAVNVINDSELDGSIISAGEGSQNIVVSDSKMNKAGIYAGSYTSETHISLTNSTLDATETKVAQSISSSDSGFDAPHIFASSTTALSLNIDHSDVTDDIVLLNQNSKTPGTSNVNITDGSTVTGDITLAGNSANTIALNSRSKLNGNINAGKESGNTTIVVDNATVNGDITTGSGDDAVTLVNDAKVTGNVDGGAGSNTLSLDEGSSIEGEVNHFATINTAGNNDVTFDNVDADTTLNVENGSVLTVDGTTGDHVQVNMTDDSQADLGTVDEYANDSLVVTHTSLSTANQQNVKIASFNTTSSTPNDAVSATFSNGSRQVETRSGAYNYDDSLTEQQQEAAGGLQDANGYQYAVLFSSSRSALASDVQGMIAGLDAAKQAGRMITDDLANRLNQVHLQNLYGYTTDGAQLWGDFLYQNGDYSDDVDYKDVTQGVQGGVDWTTHLSNGDSLTGGIALGWTRSRDRSNDGGSNNFNDSVYSNDYSVYGGWQQSLHDNLWGIFVDGSFSYGDMRYSTSANNVTNSTTGMTQALNGSSDGSLYTTQARAGVNVLLPGETVLQPYATVGWDKAQENGFSDQEMTFGDSRVSEWNTGVGMRITTKLADLNKNVELYPWLDARYQTEFSDNTDIKAADYHNTDGHNAAMGIFGAGINTTIGKDFSLNTGVYFGSGDVDNDASVQVGMSYHF